MNADGSNVRRLTNAPGYDGGPFFSSDGRKIIWRRFSVDGRSAEIYIMNVDGSEQRQTHPSWPDVVGAVFSSLGRLFHFFLEPIWTRQFRAVHHGCAGQR